MPMDPKHTFYLRQAEEAGKMASQVSNEDTRRAWLVLAGDWLRMIPSNAVTDEERFEGMARDLGTRQSETKSEN